MTEVSYRLATAEDARAVAAQAHDIDHLTACALGVTLEEAAVTSVRMSAGEAWAAHMDGQLAAIFGVVPLNVLTGFGTPWLITTKVIDTRKQAFYRQSVITMAKLRKRYEAMTSVVDHRHERSLRWVRRLGFTVGPAVARGPAGMLFHEIKYDLNEFGG